jgi:uncharacterized protein (DUF885 family)
MLIRDRVYLTKTSLYQGSLTLYFWPESILNCFFMWKSRILQIMLNSLFNNEPTMSTIKSVYARGGRSLAALLLTTFIFSPQSFAQVSVIKLSPDKPAGKREISPVESETALTARFDRLVDEYFAALFAFSPTWGTQVGFHQYDGELEDLSQQSLKRYEEKLLAFRQSFSSNDFDRLSRAGRLDRAMVLANISASLLDLQELHSFNRDPDKYPSLIADSVFSLTKRNFAPLDERLKSVIARLEKAPALFAAARANLDPKAVPPIYASVALEQLPGTIDLFKTTIPDAYQKADAALLNRFRKANDKVLSELTDYQSFIKDKIVPVASGNFGIGADAYSKKLLFDEMESESLPVILQNGYTELSRLQKRFKALAAEIAPGVDERKCFESIAEDHPSPDKLVSSTDAVLSSIADYIEKKKIVSIPSANRVTVAESPSFMRALTFASMDTPGPYEEKATEAFYYVTPPESSWDKTKIEEHMRFFSYADLINTSVHEAYPGHYTQFLWLKQAPSKVRKILGCSSNAEGWAHYCEEMMIEEKLPATADGNVMAAKKLELVQLHDALLRACRYIVGIEMHTGKMTFDQGVAFFIKEGFMEKANAERETKRGTKDPTYLVYTLGKLKILALRDEYKAKMSKEGKTYNMTDFHNRFLKCGYPPLKVVRTELLDLPYTN